MKYTVRLVVLMKIFGLPEYPNDVTQRRHWLINGLVHSVTCPREATIAFSNVDGAYWIAFGDEVAEELSVVERTWPLSKFSVAELVS